MPLDEADVLVTVGGDGTLLHALHLIAAADREVPVFGLHRGTTGFLLNAWPGRSRSSRGWRRRSPSAWCRSA